MVEMQGGNNFTHRSIAGDCGFTDSSWAPQLKTRRCAVWEFLHLFWSQRSRDVTIVVTTAAAYGRMGSLWGRSIRSLKRNVQWSGCCLKSTEWRKRIAAITRNVKGFRGKFEGTGWVMVWGEVCINICKGLTLSGEWNYLSRNNRMSMIK